MGRRPPAAPEALEDVGAVFLGHARPLVGDSGTEPSGRVLTVTSPPGGECTTAFSTRLRDGIVRWHSRRP